MSQEGVLEMLKSRTLRKRGVVIFCLLAMVTIAANLAMVLTVGQQIAVSRILVSGSTTPEGSENPGPQVQALEKLGQRVYVLLGVTVCSLAAMLYFLVTRIVVPVTATAKIVQEMVRGNLAATIPSYPGGELQELGSAINDLAVNFQEVLLLTGTAVGNSCAAMDGIERLLEHRGVQGNLELKGQLIALRANLEMLASVVRDFEYFQTRFDGCKVVPCGPDEELRTQQEPHPYGFVTKEFHQFLLERRRPTERDKG